jgi:Xaa-Pro aminopeptidase
MNLLVYGDTLTSPALRHEVPVAIGDAFLYLESDGRRAVLTNALEDERIARAAPDLERMLGEQLGRDDLIQAGHSRAEIDLELAERAVARFGIPEAAVPPEFPIALADRLRAAGVELVPDEDLFVERRRRKTAAEMAGIRRASQAALSAMREAAAMIRGAEIDGDGLSLGGQALTSEAVRERIREVCARAGAPAPADIMIKPMGPNPEGGHEPGSGPLLAHTPIEIDLWPQDEESGCWSDMTRTFVRGEISDSIAALHELVLDAHEQACGAVAPGVSGRRVYGLACDVFEGAGHPTGRSKAPGETLREGFYFALGHGVGLEVHEAPLLGRIGDDTLIEGDVIAVEPGTSVSALGGCRVEDLLLVTADGSERLTGTFPYGLAP